MAKEIERKFLVRGEGFRQGARARPMRQGYVCSHEGRTVRVRIAGEEAFLTLKGASVGASRDEFEYPIPIADARQMLESLCERPLVEKTRYEVPFGRRTWEVDVFEGDNEGLVVAEVELDDEHERVSLPPWAGEEVTGDDRYYNANLQKRPFKTW